MCVWERESVCVCVCMFERNIILFSLLFITIIKNILVVVVVVVVLPIDIFLAGFFSKNTFIISKYFN